ncbi:hypothetical protein RDABS01_011265 [Bienertia sinuspersici]
MKCRCGIPCATRTSWTHENPGRKFVACKFFNHETGQRGCNTFYWVDEEQTYWQRDVINVLVAEKHRVATDLSIVKARFTCLEHEKKRLTEELDKIERKPLRAREAVMEKGSAPKQGGFKIIVICVVISVFFNFMFMKMFG